jgi:protein-L-isoaspartate(D-aspartate) O-methyltransferase
MSTPGGSRPKFPLQLEGLVKPAKTLVQPPVPKPAAQPVRPVSHAAREVLRPQQPLRLAAGDAARAAQPLRSGVGLDSAEIRQRMVDKLRASGLRHEAVIRAMAAVPRHLFVDSALVTQAYEDTSLPIGLGQTISKPSVVARMIELLMAGRSASAMQGLGRTLEIGTGCGYQAAVLSQLARQVMSVERLKPLHDKARELLAPLRPMNLRLIYGDGMRGHPPNAPYTSIISAAGGEALPQAWLDQLDVGGRLVAPVHDGNRQVLVVVDRTESGYQRSTHEAVLFVPLKSGLD